MSFSSPTVRSLAKNQFVCTYTNTEGDPTAGQSIQHAPSDSPGICVRGNGKQNVQTLFLTPEGNIFHVATGFLSADDVTSEMKFALELFKKLKNVSEGSERRELVADAHRKRLKSEGFDDQEISERPGMEIFSMMRRGGGNTGGANPFDSFIKGQFLADNKFSIHRPLVAAEQFQQQPEMLVGNGKSFFASQSSGNGSESGPELMDAMRRMMRGQGNQGNQKGQFNQGQQRNQSRQRNRSGQFNQRGSIPLQGSGRRR